MKERRGRVGVLAVLALGFLVDPVQAGIPLPCTGESIVKVLDVPATKGLSIPANRDMDIKVIDLGYKFKGCLGGEWVGYIGSSRRYLPLTPSALKSLLELAGRKEPPPVPTMLTHPSGNMANWFWLVMLGLVVVGSFLKRAPKTGVVSPEEAMAEVMATAPSTGPSRPPAAPVVTRVAIESVPRRVPIRPAARTLRSESGMPGARAAFGRR